MAGKDLIAFELCENFVDFHSAADGLEFEFDVLCHNTQQTTCKQLKKLKHINIFVRMCYMLDFGECMYVKCTQAIGECLGNILRGLDEVVDALAVVGDGLEKVGIVALAKAKAVDGAGQRLVLPSHFFLLYQKNVKRERYN